jgi:hypothetical protein
MSKGTYTQKKAVLVRLLNNPNKLVSYPDLEQFTRRMCDSYTTQVNTRVVELRKLGYTIINVQANTHGVVHSSYRVVISNAELIALRKAWVNDKKTIPNFKKVKESMVPKQSNMFVGAPPV